MIALRCHRGVLCGLVFALTLAGCAVGPPYRRPATPAPQQWATPSATTQWPTQNWWRAFNDATLDGLETRALAGNHDLKAAVARVAEARAQLQVAGAALYPSLGLDAESGRAKPFAKGGSQKIKLYNYYQLGLTASYELDLFGANRDQALAAAANLKGSEFDRETVSLGLAAGVANTWFALTALDARLKIAHEAVVAAQKTLDLLQLQQRYGSVDALQVAQQKSLLDTLTASIPPLQTQRQQTQNALALLLGRLPEGFDPVSAALDTISIPAPPAGLPSGLLERRPDVARAEATLVAANANVRAATAAFYPQIALTAQGGSGSLALQTLLKPGSIFFSLAASLTAPLFEGGKLRGQLAYDKARYRELAENYQQAVLAAFSDTENALGAQSLAQSALASRTDAAQQAARALELAQLQYRQGTTSYLTVLDSQRTALDARDAEAQARLARLQAAVSLYQALGGGWTKTAARPDAQP